MKLAELLESDLIPPGQRSPADHLDPINDPDQEEDRRSDEIYKIANLVGLQYMKAFKQAGLPLDTEDGNPVGVDFLEDERQVEISVSIPEYEDLHLMTLLRLVQQNLIPTSTKISTGRAGVVLSMVLPADQTPFKQFL